MAKKYLIKGEGYQTVGIMHLDESHELLALYEDEEIYDTYDMARIVLLKQLDAELLTLSSVIQTLEKLSEEEYFKPLEKLK